MIVGVMNRSAPATKSSLRKHSATSVEFADMQARKFDVCTQAALMGYGSPVFMASTVVLGCAAWKPRRNSEYLSRPRRFSFCSSPSSSKPQPPP